MFPANENWYSFYCGSLGPSLLEVILIKTFEIYKNNPNGNFIRSQPGFLQFEFDSEFNEIIWAENDKFAAIKN